MSVRLFAALVASLLAVTACGGGESTSTSAVKGRQLVVGYSNQEPYSWINESGDLVGLDPDIQRECARRLGMPPPKYVQVDFDGLLPGLQSGRFDMTVVMAYLPERDQVADPAYAAYIFRSILEVQKGNPLDIHTPEDLKAAEGKIGALRGAAEATQLQGDPDFADRVVLYDNNIDMYKDLEAGRIIAAADGEPLAIVYLAHNPDAKFEISDYPPFYASGGHFYFRSDDDALREAFNGCITDMKQDGTLLKILEKYNYPTENMAPVDATNTAAPDF